MIVYKSDNLVQEFAFLDPRLKIVLWAAAGMLDNKYKTDLVITCIYRDEDGSLHKLNRAVDIRIIPTGGARAMSREAFKSLQDLTDAFIYDLARPSLKTMYIHENRGPKGGTGLHGHIQVNGHLKTLLINTREE